MAKNSIGLFMQQIGQAEGELQVKVAKIVFDLFMVHDPFNLLTGVMPVRLDPTLQEFADKSSRRNGS